ncbi:TetR family transcriptional regulator C-terminal domain-containing protein [Actinomadura atramentaria]|uniref:TetR family transcriptional regulator C-terminal domain-containing protein n=1 Tax=Actinomadura atramentaria TaxID=1990 RepID=UPI001F0AE77A|nr:hypothetical protein [Actinomadura atramentaria]
MIRPASRSRFKPSCTIKNGARTFTAKTSSKPSSVSDARSALRPMPALLTMMSANGSGAWSEIPASNADHRAALREEPTAYGAFARILREAAVIYPDPAHPAGCLATSAATNVTPADAEVGAFLRDLHNKNVDGFEARLREAQQAGELPAETDPRALADYFAIVLQGLSQRAQDGATAAQLTAAVEVALTAWPTTRP